MAKQLPDYEVIDKLKGSKQHHDLKDRPGEKGDPDHVEDGDAKPDTDSGSGDKD